jgi:hypothetical protein
VVSASLADRDTHGSFCDRQPVLGSIGEKAEL